MELAGNYVKGTLRLKTIAQRQDISIKYLEQIIATLRTAGIVRSIRGSKGGYLLARAPNLIKLSDVFTALEGPLVTVDCVEDEKSCLRVSDCLTRSLWVDIQKAVMAVLDSKNLQDLIEQAKDTRGLYYQI